MRYFIAYCLVLLALFLIHVLVLRWIFRIDKQINLLTEIRDLLKNLRSSA